MITIEIDGKKLEVEAGAMIIEAADNAGIYIPRFCYHKKLSIAANCRMCLVEVDKSRKPLPACATPVNDGMKIYTATKMAKEAQAAVMEFLLINHPLDCPICDQGGQCELQDFSMGFGIGDSNYDEGKRSLADENFGSLIATEMTRCIHCTRCVRFSREIAGVYDLGATGRGEITQIGTYVQKTLSSELSGNIIDLCPVGALTSKPFLFSARAWELEQHDAIAPHDCLGSNVHVHTRRGQVMRVVPRENEAINETWLSDRDRFSYTALRAEDRLGVPLVKHHGQWQEVSWQDALNAAARGLRQQLVNHGAEQLGVLASASASIEELYLLQQLTRGLGSNNIDHRVRQTDFSDQTQSPLFPSLGCSIEDFAKADVFLMIGSDPRAEQPLLAHRIRQAVLQQAKLMFINPYGLHMHCDVAKEHVVPVLQMVQSLAGVAKVLIADAEPEKVPAGAQALLTQVQISEHEKYIAQLLRQAQRPKIVLGALALQHPQAATLRALAKLVALLLDTDYGCLTEGANAAGACLAGVLPHRTVGGYAVPTSGLDAQSMLAAKLRSYIIYGLEPELDCFDGALASSALHEAEFVVVLSPFISDAMQSYADVILPIAAFTETAATFVNTEGHWQTFQGAAAPFAEVRPGWKVLRVLANLADLPGFTYESVLQVHDELLQLVQQAPGLNFSWQAPATLLPTPTNGVTRFGHWPIYRIDSTVRRAQPLQQIGLNRAVGIYMNRQMAQQLHVADQTHVMVQQLGNRQSLSLFIDEQIPDQTVLIPNGYAQTANLGPAIGSIEIGRG